MRRADARTRAPPAAVARCRMPYRSDHVQSEWERFVSDDGQQQPALPRRSGAKIDRRRFLAVSGLAGAAAMFGPGVVGPIAASADPVLTYGDADRPPFSFTYGGTAFAALMSRWTRTGP